MLDYLTRREAFLAAAGSLMTFKKLREGRAKKKEAIADNKPEAKQAIPDGCAKITIKLPCGDVVEGDVRMLSIEHHRDIVEVTPMGSAWRQFEPIDPPTITLNMQPIGEGLVYTTC